MTSLVLASTSMMAMDLQYFLGAGAERVDADVKGTFDYSIDGESGSFSGTESFKDTGLLLKAGVILDKTHRVSLSHRKFSKDETDATTILGSYDYLITMNEQFRLYAGAHLGNTKVDFNYMDFDMSGLTYGAQVGAIYDITKNVEFELGFAYSKYNVDKSISVSEGADFLDANLELEDSTSMFAGLNFKF